MRLRRAHTCALVLSLASLLIPLLPASTSASAAGARAPRAPEKIDGSVARSFQRNAKVTFWVDMKPSADLTHLAGSPRSIARGEDVLARLKQAAATTQTHVKAIARSRGASFRSFFITNAVKVTGGEDLMKQLAALPEVQRIRADDAIDLPEPIPAETVPTPNALTWGLNEINAQEAWGEFGARGSGIVVANIDTGAQFDHPALVRQYRGNAGDGTFDHNYNWFDPSAVCPEPLPCDNDGHGTHTMGTMVGADPSGDHQIGVAPQADWIAAKGCETSSCSRTALLASAQWILAPTDLSGQNPRPDLRPHVVNNSWGSTGGDSWYRDSVNAWVAAGIFPAFSNGNNGSGCSSAGTPGDYAESYSAGAYDAGGAIADFSSRGPSLFGDIKPDIAAPGVAVTSSLPADTYGSLSGTSMASPHVAGTVAALWSAAPSLLRDVEETRRLLDGTARDTSDTECGGTESDNNVWGEGKLDVLSLLRAAPVGPAGSLEGTVTSQETGLPIAGARVTISKPSARSLVTDGAGDYSARLPVGTYDVSASLFGFVTRTVTVEITDGAVTRSDLELAVAPAHSLSGRVTDSFGAPIPDARLVLKDTPIDPVRSNEQGDYVFASIPRGTYALLIEGSRCTDVQQQSVDIEADHTLDISLPSRHDGYGYTCRPDSSAYVDATTPLSLSGDDEYASVELPFAFPFYGRFHRTVYVSTNGLLSFTNGTWAFANALIPSSDDPNGAIYPYWEDLHASPGEILSESLGTAPNRSFVIEYRDVDDYSSDTSSLRFEVVLHENGDVVVHYAEMGDTVAGSGATIGLEDQTGTDAFVYSVNEASVHDGLVLRYLSRRGRVAGSVVNDEGVPIVGARVGIVGQPSRSVTTDASGAYSMALPHGSHQLTAEAPGYVSDTREVSIGDDDVGLDFALARVPMTVTGRVTHWVDGSFRPVGGARLRAFDEGTLLSETRSGADGSYSMTLPTDVYDLYVVAGRFAPQVRRVKGGPSGNVTRSFHLRICDIVGTDRADVLVGTGGSDVICGRAGDDVIRGHHGADILYGEEGRDHLRGHEKHDRLFGGSGNDVLRGGLGNDRLDGGLGVDRLNGGVGADACDPVGFGSVYRCEPLN